jgi:hypothetical protein
MNDLYTFKQFVSEQKLFTEAGLRDIIFKRDKNNLQKSGAILRYGKKIIIDKEKFFKWFKDQYAIPPEN